MFLAIIKKNTLLLCTGYFRPYKGVCKLQSRIIKRTLTTNDITYVKLTNKECCHNGFKFVEGLNIDTVPFTSLPRGLKPFGGWDCEPGGIYFTTYKNINRWMKYGDKKMHYIWDVMIPKDAQVHHQEDKSKADKIILSNRKTLSDFFSENHDIALINIKGNRRIFRYIKNKTPELCMALVKYNGCALEHPIGDP